METTFDKNEHIGRLARRPYLGMMKEVYAWHEKNRHEDVKPAHSIVFQFIGSGARITDMAQKANTSKQNMKYLVGYLEDKGYVERWPDAADGRAWLFKLTAKGEIFRTSTYHIIKRVEQKWTGKLGKHKMETLRALLAELSDIIITEHGYL